MSILTYPIGFIGGGVTLEFYNGVMENSLRMNGEADQLHRTFDGTGVKVATFSWWMKSAVKDDNKMLNATGGYYHVFTDTGAPSTGDLYLMGYGGGGDEFKSVTAKHYFRDSSAWYHHVFSFNCNADTTASAAAAAKRNRIYTVSYTHLTLPTKRIV